MKRILLSIALLLSAASLYGQGTPSEGKDYYLGFIYPSYNTVVPTSSAGYFHIYAIISSFQDNTAYVSYFNEDGTEEAAQPYKVQARKAVQIPLSVSKLRSSADQTAEYKALHITAKKPINVQFFSTGGCSGGMYLALPTNGLGTKYTIASYRDNPDLIGSYVGNNGPSLADSSRGIYQIVGAYNGTTVTITNSIATSIGTPEKEPFTIMLNRGQCYTVRSRNHLVTDDISGSIIESDKPIAVIAGHENAYMGGADNKPVEQRDLMIEQMIPYDYHDNTGYIMIPMPDGTAIANNGKGDNVRINTHDQTVTVTPYIEIGGTPITASSILQKYGTLQYSNVQFPSSFSASKPISVVQYDMANHGSDVPYARPSMMTIIPRSRWRNAYLWFVQQKVLERTQGDYITVIAPKTKFDSIYISKGGQKDVLIGQAGLAIVSEYLTIPDHPDLKAAIYKIVPGSYYARANFPMMIYSYGHRAAANGILGNFDGDDLYFSYATPLGMVLGNGDSSQMTITVDTLCTGWRICATDKHVDGGIKSAFLADDPIGDIYPFEPQHGPYQYYNTSFTPEFDPNGTRELIFDGEDTTECFEVHIDNIGKDGYAPLIITDKAGNGKMIELYYKKAAVAYNPSPDSTTNCGIQYIFDTKDMTFKFINQIGSQRPYLIEQIELLKKSPAFQILSYTPAKPLPFTLAPGDTLLVKVRFTNTDTGYFSDSLLLKTDCFTTYWPIEGTVGTGLIAVSDHDFENVVMLNSTACTDTVKVHNVGNMPYMLTPGYVLFDNVDFSFDGRVTTSSNRTQDLPVIIQPGDWVKLRVCFTPHTEGSDSTDLVLKTDIHAPYEHTIKDVIHLKGRGIKPDVKWDRDTGYMRMDSTRTNFMRRYLINPSTAQIRIDSVFIAGPDASEFKVEGLQNALELGIDVGDSVWVDISVTPDLTKPANFHRIAYLIATNTFDKEAPDTVELVAGYDILKVPQELQLEELRIHPNPTLGEDITASFGLVEPKELRFAVYDMLGREVLSVPASYFAKGKQSVTLPVSKLGEGGYILRVSDGTLTQSISFRVVK